METIEPMIEFLRPGASATRARVVVFDFDGTISLIRAGWLDVMVPMMAGILQDLDTGESEEELTEIVREYVGRLTGKQTMYQMIALADEIKKRGGVPKEALEYKKQYLDLLWDKIKGRIEELETGDAKPEKYLVPGAIGLLKSLRERGLKMYLASGTDQVYMRREADLLGVSQYFDGGVFGALDDYKKFSKAILIRKLISEAECKGDEFLGFGDGYVEIENIKEVGGVAVGVATDEPDCKGVDGWKRRRLASVGADFIIPHFEPHDELMAALFPK